MKLQSAIRLWLTGAVASAGQVWASANEERHARDLLKENAFHVVRRIFKNQDSKKASHPQEQLKTSSHRPETKVLWDGQRLIPIHEEEKSPFKSKKFLTDAELVGGRLVNAKETPRRVNSRRRRVKGGSKKGLPKAAKGAKDALKILRKKTKGAKGEAGTEFLCFQGTYQDVSAACDRYNADCCIGEDACSWMNDPTRPTTICQGACVGKAACMGIGQGSYVSPNACQQDYSCFYLATSSAQKEPVDVGRGACSGRTACAGICYTSEECKVEVGNFACIGEAACNTVAFYSPVAKEIEIDSDACQDGFACYKIANQNINLVEVDIASGACELYDSCSLLGFRGVGESVSVGKDSCVREGSCVGLGLTASNVVVDDNACAEYTACYFLGYKARGDISVSHGACNKPSSCEQLGSYAKDISIDEEACLGNNACKRLGYTARGDVSVGFEACGYDNACTYLGESTFYPVSVAEYSCRGPNVCSALGRPVTDGGVQVGKNACNAIPRDYRCSGFRYDDCLNAKRIPRGYQSCAIVA